MADAWIVNASPLIALAHADKLELLEKLPSELVVPEAASTQQLDRWAERILTAGSIEEVLDS